MSHSVATHLAARLWTARLQVQLMSLKSVYISGIHCYKQDFSRSYSMTTQFTGMHLRELKITHSIITGSRDRVVSIATRYGLEGQGIESRWGEIFRNYSDQLRGPPSLLYNGHRVFPGCKGGRGVMLTTPLILVPRLRKSWAIPPLTLWNLLCLLRGSP